MASEKKLLALDLGGSAIKYGLWDGEKFSYCFAKPKLIPCTYRSDANLVGAAYHFEREYEGK